MIFASLSEEISTNLQGELYKLFQLALKNQNHSGDLLLLINNYRYDKNNFFQESPHPHLTGPNEEGLSNDTHYKYIMNYVKSSLIADDWIEFLEKLKAHAIDDRFNEALNLLIQDQFYIYLKIWENEFLLKLFCQFIKLVEGKEYAYEFSYKSFGNSKPGFIRKELRKPLGNYPFLLKCLEFPSTNQIRNAFAHSNYWFMNQSIILTNYNRDSKYDNIQVIPIAQWLEHFHYTIEFYRLFHTLIFDTAHIYYQNMAQQTSGRIEVKVKSSLSNHEYRLMEQRFANKSIWNIILA